MGGSCSRIQEPVEPHEELNQIRLMLNQIILKYENLLELSEENTTLHREVIKHLDNIDDFILALSKGQVKIDGDLEVSSSDNGTQTDSSDASPASTPSRCSTVSCGQLTRGESPCEAGDGQTPEQLLYGEIARVSSMEGETE